MGWLDSITLFRPRPVAPAEAPAAEKSAAELMAEALDAAEANDYETALAIWGPLAHQGVARAQNNIGKCFSEGLGVARDTALALQWLTLAADAGDKSLNRRHHD
jgi:TPR repeat protein